MKKLVATLAISLVACSGTTGDSGTRDSGARDSGRDGGSTSTDDGGSTTDDGGSTDVDSGGVDGGEVVTAGDRFFPDGAWFYQRIDGASGTVRSDSAATTGWLTDNGGWGTGRMQIDFSIEVLFADATTPTMTFEATDDFYDPDCDLVPVPVPAGGALEGETGYACESDGDCHLIVMDGRVHRLFEMWRANITGGTFYGGCLAAWDTSRVYAAEARGDQCTSADAAGFPIAPLLFTADEVAAGHIDHAIRFILPNARMRRGFYVHPGTHVGGPSADADSAPIYGSRWRLRGDYPLDTLPNEAARVVARAMQQYGIALADGGNIALTARTDRSTTAHWDGLLDPRDLELLQPNDFEVVDTGAPITVTNDCIRTTY